MNDNRDMPEDTCPPAFWTDLTESDIPVLKSQSSRRNFDTELIYAVAKRCRGGYPQVVVCRPLTPECTPFPTLFWLTCPYLDRRCGELESQQKIAGLEDIFKSRLSDVIIWHQKYSRLRVGLLGENEAAEIENNNPAIWKAISSCGAGGINWREIPFAAKCLHLQTATWLGMGTHPASDWLESEIFPLECAQLICRLDSAG